MNRDGLLGCHPFGKIITLEHARYRVSGGQPHPFLGGQGPQPAIVEIDNGLLGIQNLEDLFLVGFRVFQDLFPGQGRAGLVSPRRISDPAGEVSDEKNDAVAQILKVFHLTQQHGVAQVQIGRRRIKADLDGKWLPALLGFFEFPAKLFFCNGLGSTL